MDLRIHPSPLSGTVTPPPSKSMAHRLLIAAALAEGKSRIENIAFSKDIEATLRCMELLGCRWQRDGDAITLQGRCADLPAQPFPHLDCGESGSTLRFLIPVALALRGGASFTGHGRLMERPQQPYFDLFEEKGIAYELQGGVLTVRGQLTPGVYSLPGNVSSQFFTGLLFALSLLDEPSTIRSTTPLESADYVTMTIDAMAAAFGRNGAWDSSDVTTRSATAPEAPNGRVVSQTIDSGTGTVTANLDYTQVGYWEPDPEDPFERVSNLTPEYRYSVDNGITWTTWATLPMNAASGSFSIAGLPAGRSVIVQMRTLQSWSDNYGDRGTGYSTVVSIAFDTEGYPEDTLSIAWSYDELRRNFITYSISDDFWHGARTFELTVKRDGAVLSQGSVNVPAGSNSGQLVFPLSESAIGGWTPGGLVQNGPYIPNESLDYEVKTIMNNEVVATLTGSFVTTRPIIGVVINDAGSKYYITDAVKAGGVASADDFKFDSRYDRFIIKN